MRILVSGGTRTVRRLASRWPAHLGHLVTPATGNSIQSVVASGLPWACDNGAFAGFDPAAFRRMLRRCSSAGLWWIVCPDAVGSAKDRLKMFDDWHQEVAGYGPVAFVAQDGQEDLPVPWWAFKCLFIGGSTKFKLSEAAGELARQANSFGRMVHVGRVNTQRRLRFAWDLGADSVDGTQFSRWGDTHLEKSLRFVKSLEAQPTMI